MALFIIKIVPYLIITGLAISAIEYARRIHPYDYVPLFGAVILIIMGFLLSTFTLALYFQTNRQPFFYFTYLTFPYLFVGVYAYYISDAPLKVHEEVVEDTAEEPPPEPEPVKPLLHFLGEVRYSGMWIVAPQGKGKTNLLQYMFFDDYHAPNSSIIVMDSKGDFLSSIRDLKEIKDRVVIIEPDLTKPLSLNPLDLPINKTDPMAVSAAVKSIDELFALLDAAPTTTQSAFSYNILYALITAVHEPNLRKFKAIVDGSLKLTPDEINHIPDHDVKEFFLQDRIKKTGEATKAALAWRIDYILQNPALKAMFTAPTNKFNMGELMDSGAIILINNAKSIFYNDEKAVEFFSRFFLTLVLSAAQQRQGRAAHEKPSVFFYLDECQDVIRHEPKFATIIHQCRSQRIAMICSHQELQQIPNQNVRSALENCAVKFANCDAEAPLLAPLLHVAPTKVLRAAGKKDERLVNGPIDPDFLRQPIGTFAAYVRDHQRNAFHVAIPYTDNLKHLPKTTPLERRQLSKRMDEYTYTPQEPAPAPALTLVPALSPPPDDDRPKPFKKK